MKVAIYTRVSGKSNRQDAANQSLQLIEYCARQGWDYVEYSDRMSGTKAPTVPRSCRCSRMRGRDGSILFFSGLWTDSAARARSRRSNTCSCSIATVWAGRVTVSNISIERDCSATRSSRSWPRSPNRNTRGSRSGLLPVCAGRNVKGKFWSAKEASWTESEYGPCTSPVSRYAQLPPRLARPNRSWQTSSKCARGRIDQQEPKSNGLQRAPRSLPGSLASGFPCSGLFRASAHLHSASCGVTLRGIIASPGRRSPMEPKKIANWITVAANLAVLANL